jgi:hypothetical protein
MHKLIELITTGALYTFAPLLLLLAVDLVCWSVPIVWKGVSEEFPRLQLAHAKRGCRSSNHQ